jgi:hypothetical protein
MKNLVIAFGTLAVLTAPALAGKTKSKKSTPIVADKAGREIDARREPASDTRTLAPPRPADKAPKRGLGMGESFDLVPRRSAQPKQDLSAVEAVAKPKTLTDVQVSTVVSKHSREIQHCWNKLPQAQRVDACSVMLKLSIEAAGKVSAIELSGDVPAGAHKCITAAAMRWQFPAVEEASEIETGVSLRSL